MTGTFELSYYPLRDTYPDSVLRVLDELRALEGVQLETHGMSTILIGDFDRIWKAIGELSARRLREEDAVIVLKAARGRREYVD